jgi:hypothetical protein
MVIAVFKNIKVVVTARIGIVSDWLPVKSFSF